MCKDQSEFPKLSEISMMTKNIENTHDAIPLKLSYNSNSAKYLVHSVIICKTLYLSFRYTATITAEF